MATLTEWIPREEKYCLFLGAGFSKWAADLPTAAELFDFNIKLWGVREVRKLDELQRIKKIWDAENPCGYSEEFTRWMIESSKKDRQLVTWYIARRLADPFIVESYSTTAWGSTYRKRRVMMFDDTRRFQSAGVIKAKKFIDSLLGPHFEGIITTNYDLLIEYALGTRGFNYGEKMQLLHGQWAMPIRRWRDGPVILKGDLSLLKLHGSISLTEKGYCTDGRGGVTGRALIIPPTQNKELADFVSNEWNHAGKMLENSCTLIFFGFAFNQYDLKILALLKDTEEWMKKIILINRNPRVIRQASTIWPSAKITFIHSDDLDQDILTLRDELRNPSVPY